MIGARACGGARPAGHRARGPAIGAAWVRRWRGLENAAARGVGVSRSIAGVSALRPSRDGNHDSSRNGPNDVSTANGMEQRA